MDEENMIESSPMDHLFSSDVSRKPKRSPKRKYDEDSGYTTTPGSSLSTFGASWGLETTDEGFAETPGGQDSFWGECVLKDWNEWDERLPPLPVTPEVAIKLPADSPTQPKVMRSRDLPSSYTSEPASEFSIKRPKCIDFSQTDFIHRFAISSNLPHILNIIYSFVSDSDITSMTMVSKTWYDVITSNKDTKDRWLKNIALRKSSKENLNVLEKCSWVRSPLKTRNHSTPISTIPYSPPCSPSRMKFNLYRREAEKLKEGEKLMHCPNCDLPSRCTPDTNLGKCVRMSCAFEFCTLCRRPYHRETPCIQLTPPGDRTPQKRITKAQSRRNLRRLLD